MNLRSRRNKTTVALMVAVALILVGYFTREATQPRRAVRKQVPAGVYTVEYVYDGDSLRLTNGAGVRIVGIDAPEKDEKMADEARAFAKEFLEGRTVRLAPAEEHMDRYGRNLAYLYLKEDGGEVFVNAELVRHGCAYAWPYKPNTRHAAEILTAQEEAQAARRGLWARTLKELKSYVVTVGQKYSLTHRPECPILKKSHKKKLRLENRLEAINCNGGAPPCRECKP